MTESKESDFMPSIRSHVSDYGHEKEKKKEKKKSHSQWSYVMSTSPSDTWQCNDHHYCLREARYLTRFSSGSPALLEPSTNSALLSLC